MQQHNNPYHQASNAYSNNKAASLSNPRTMEAQALLKAAAKLDAAREMLKTKEAVRLPDIMPALDYQKKLWIVFADSAGDESHPLPQEIKNNIASLSVFMFKRIIDVMAEPKADKLDVMIEINRQLASGLMKTPPKDETAEDAEAQQAPENKAAPEKGEPSSIDA